MPLKLNQEEGPAINLTSMIDVLFLLIIFFMVGTKFTENEGGIEVNLPKVSNGGAMMPAPMGKTVSLKADGTIHFNGAIVSLADLENQIQQATRNYPDLKIDFEADGACSYQMTCEVMASVQRAGNTNLNLRYAKYSMPNASLHR